MKLVAFIAVLSVALDMSVSALPANSPHSRVVRSGSGKSGDSGNSGKSDKSDKSGNSGNSGKSDKSGKSGKSGNSGKDTPKSPTSPPTAPPTAPPTDPPTAPPPKLFQVPVEPGAAVDAMASFNQGINAAQSKTHGCHCSKWTRNENVGGAPIDDFDAGCRDWNSKLRCLELPGGACSAGIDFTFYTIQVQQNGMISDDADFNCAFAGDACKTAICKIGYQVGQNLWESVAKKGPGSYFWNGYNANANCIPNVPEYAEKICVGQAPNVFIQNA